MSQPDKHWRMIERRARAAGIRTRIGNHSFRATGITEYLRMAASSRSHRRWPITKAREPQSSTTAPTQNEAR